MPLTQQMEPSNSDQFGKITTKEIFQHERRTTQHKSRHFYSSQYILSKLTPSRIKKPIEIIVSLWPAAVEQTHHLKMFGNITAATLRITLVINVLRIAFSILRQIIHLFIHLQSAVLFTFLLGFPETSDGDFQRHFVGGLHSFLLQSKAKVPLIFGRSKEL